MSGRVIEVGTLYYPNVSDDVTHGKLREGFKCYRILLDVFLSQRRNTKGK